MLLDQIYYAILNHFMRSVLNYNSDQLGIASSTICFLHCIATPFIFAARSCSINSCCASSPLWWRLVDVVFLGIALVAVYHSAQKSTKQWLKWALYLSFAGLAFMVLNDYLQFLHLPQWLTFVPPFALISLHAYHLRSCQCQQCCSDPVLNT